MTDTDAFGGDGGVIAVDPVSGRQTALSQGGNFVDPAGVALAADGTILVSDMAAFGGTGGLIRVDPGSGHQTKVVSSSEFLRPLGLAVEASGQVVVAYTERPPPPPNPGIVMRVNPANGEHHLVSPDAHMLFPAFLAHDASGSVLATEPDAQGADSRLFRLVEGGGAEVLLEGKPEGAIYSGLVVEPNGNILVASAGQLDRGALLRFDPASGAVATVASGDKLVNPMAVALGADGGILVVDRHNGIVRIDPGSGAQTIVTGGDLFNAPLDLAVVR